MKPFTKFQSFSILLLFLFINHTHEIQLKIINNCTQSIWPATQGSSGKISPKEGGFHLATSEEISINVPFGWSGRIWGRQGCCFDEQGNGFCQTGDCGGKLHCKGNGLNPPATLIEMTFGLPQSPLHYYDVSLVDGFNLPVSMEEDGKRIGCGVASCKVNLNVCCPSRFGVSVGEKIVGCKSACLALQTDKYCCTGEYSSPSSCKPTLFSYMFKSLCPGAYSFAFDDATSLNKCMASSYVITFCPRR